MFLVVLQVLIEFRPVFIALLSIYSVTKINTPNCFVSYSFIRSPINIYLKEQINSSVTIMKP